MVTSPRREMARESICDRSGGKMPVVIQIQVSHNAGRYWAKVTPPHGTAAWSSPTPLSPRDLVSELRELDCHTTDIADAFDATGTDWRSIYDAQVLRERSRSDGEPSA